MNLFRCVPIAATTIARFRRTGHDDRGNAVIAMQRDAAPCRCCLRNASAEQTMLLGSYDLPAPQGLYWTPSPVFVHAEDCAPFADAGTIAPIVRSRLVSLRCYDAAGMCLYDLGCVCQGAEIDAPLFRALADDRTRTINIHTAGPGCLLCEVVRA